MGFLERAHALQLSARSMNAPTPHQQKAIESTGNILVVAGAGAGKTRTLVQRCVAFLLDQKSPGSLEEVLMVTFTEAAAAEMRKRIRDMLEAQLQRAPENSHLVEQLALLESARICTLHSFCFHLVREHFHELHLDPQINILPEEQSTLLAREVLDELMLEIYEGKNSISDSVQRLVSDHGRGWDKPIRDLVKRVHAYTQTLPNPEGWFAEQLECFAQPEPARWQQWLKDELARWKNWWLPVLHSQEEENVVAQRCAVALARMTDKYEREDAAAACAEILASDEKWPTGKKGKFREPIKRIFDEAQFLHSLCASRDKTDPLAQDWDWVRPQTTALLQLARQFTKRFSDAKREIAALDFHDLEQFALELLWNRKQAKPTAVAESWRKKLRLVLVDEYQDINAAQDTILTALARDDANGNRFLVGDVKQSIYRFRLANPRIFLGYEKLWKSSAAGQVVPLSDNFRSHEAILNFVNPLFTALMKKEIGGVEYDGDAKLNFGNRSGRLALTVQNDASPRIELHLRVTGEEEESNPDLDALSGAEKEARLIGRRLLELKNQCAPVWKDGKQQPAQWSDMVILLRSPRNKAEAFAKEFARLGIPLTTARTGFYGTQEVADILNLLRLLDNPLQDLPLLAILRSPIVGLSLDELAAVRVANRQASIWTALNHVRSETLTGASSAKLLAKVQKFLDRFSSWRRLKMQSSLSQLVETILDETHYPAWLLAQPRGPQRRANIEQLLELTRQFDSLQAQGLFKFIRLIEAQESAEIDLEPAGDSAGDAVRLMSIHQSKGLEFPIVVAADLGKPFNFSDTKERVILDEIFGICPQVMPPGTRQTYPSLPYWLSQRRQKIETLGEELRLLYVALTRAVDRLILTGATGNKAVSEKWPDLAARGLDAQEISDARSFLDWIGPWLAQSNISLAETGENSLLKWTIYSENDARLSTEEMENTGIAAPKPTQVSPEALHDLKERISWSYGFPDSIKEPAKTSVSALRRRATEDDEKAQPLVQFRKARSGKKVRDQLSAAEIGTAHHAFLELVSLEKVQSEAGLRSEALRMEQNEILSAAEIAELDFAAISRFWNSEVGTKLLENADRLHREHPFTSRLNGSDFAKFGFSKAVLPDEFVVLQGVIDLAVVLPDEIWLLDFKTDQIEEPELDDRIKEYRRQVVLYADAMTKIYHRPVTQCWLHFLAPGKTVEISVN